MLVRQSMDLRGPAAARPADEVVPQAAAQKLATKLQAQKTIQVEYKTVDGANHFFGNHVEQMVALVDDYVGRSMVNV